MAAEAAGAAIGAKAQMSEVAGAVKDSAIAACIALLLFIAIVGVKTENAQGGLELVYRLGTAVSLAVGVGLLRLFFDLFVWRKLVAVNAIARLLPSGVSSPVVLGLIALMYVLGGFYFLLPGFRLEAASDISNLFGSPEWQNRARIAVELTGIVFLAIFVVLSTMGLVTVARWIWGLVARNDDVASATPQFIQQFAPALLVIAIFLPVLVAGDQQRYALDTAIQILTYIMLGWGLNVVVGLAGLLDLGYVAFYAVGAYSYALISTQFGWSFWVCLPLAGFFAAMWGIILGFPVLRLRGDYLAIVTLAFGEMIRILLLNWQSLTNGPNGVSRIPKPSFFGLSFDRLGDNTFHGFFGLEYSNMHRIIFMYYLILVLALLVNFVTTRLRRLPIGRAWEALREDEIACRSLGINTVTTKLTAFAIGAMFGGFAGSFFATRQGFISPESFTFHESALVLAIVVLGGLGSQVGVAVAAVVLIGSSEFFRDLQDYRMLIFGLSMVGIMVWRPRGIIGSREPTVILKERKSISGSLVREGAG
jgi:branched-chain amino acid transport system permease protein